MRIAPKKVEEKLVLHVLRLVRRLADSVEAAQIVDLDVAVAWHPTVQHHNLVSQNSDHWPEVEDR
jgi:hypothetical protein